MHVRNRVLAASSALVLAVFLAGAASAAGQDKKQQPPKLDKAQQQEATAAIKILDDVIAGQPAPSDFTFTWLNHSMKSRDGKAYVPFTLTFDKDKTPPASVTYFLRAINHANADAAVKAIAAARAAVTKAEAEAKLDPDNPELAEAADRAKAAQPKIEYAFEDLKFLDLKPPETGQPLRLQRAMGVPGGDYDVYVLIKERAASAKERKAQPRAGLLKVSVTVPNYWADELATSSVLMTNKTEQLNAPLTDADQASNPYVFGTTRIVPSPDGKFTKKDELSIFFYIYNTGIDKTTNKPDVTVDYNFYQKAGGTEKYFNKTAPQNFNGQTLPPQFDVKAGHQLVGGLAVPLASFPEGDYRLEIKVTDKVSGKTKVENAPFTVTAG